MRVKRTRTGRTNGGGNQPSAPPGFACRTSFRLRKVETNEPTCSSSVAAANLSKGDPVQTDSTFDEIVASSGERSFQQRPWMLHNQHMNKQDEHDFVGSSKDLPSRTFLPKGVAHGCADCSNFLQVMARWRPDNARKDVLEEAPVFHPTEEEFKDTLKYIASIHPKVEEHGICRIVPPPSWDLPCRLKEKHLWEESSFVTQFQWVDGLQEHCVQSKLTRTFENGSWKRKTSMRKDLECGVGDGCNSDHGGAGCSDTDTDIESKIGPKFTLESFKNYADISRVNTSAQVMMQIQIPPFIKRVWNHLWMIFRVLYSGDQGSGFGSGFSTNSCSSETVEVDKYLNSGWNLNCTSRLLFSLLSFESFKTSVVSVPKLKIGMCFSPSCWGDAMSILRLS